MKIYRIHVSFVLGSGLTYYIFSPDIQSAADRVKCWGSVHIERVSLGDVR